MRHKKKKTGRTALLVLLAFVLIIAIGVIGGYNMIKNYDSAFDPTSTATVDFVVPKGATTTKIGVLLKDAGLIKNDQIFKLKSKLCGYDGKYQAGEYELSSSMTMNEIMLKIQDGRRETRKITIKEGWKLADIINYLAENNIVTAEEFLYSLENDNFDQWFVKELKETAPAPVAADKEHKLSYTISSKANRFEGFLFPDTYEIYVDASARHIINKMLTRFDEVFTEDLQNKMKEKNLSLQEAVTIASLIERETVKDNERAKVSSVIYNRLNSNATGGKLQFCSTVLYSLGYHKNRVLFKDLEIDSPYNTYKYAGLPVGPICCPGKACLEAALNPADTKYLYFVVSSKGDGSHNFSSKYSDHAAFSEEYLQTIDK
ncbi:MAG: endolytic transglycosylase MltG [Clostridia bacterium]|nr:endolytic transglycosylase MltG [Clostridia bacterium]